MFLGIDVSKQTLDVALIEDENRAGKTRHKVFQNSQQGHQQMLEWLRERSTATMQVCLEATGTWADAIALALHEADYHVSLVNPSLIRAFAQSRLLRTKTDKADAQMIARFCQMHRPPRWTPPAPAIRTLQSLVRRLETLIQMHTMEENRIGSGITCAQVQNDLEDHLADLDARIKKTRCQVKDHIDQNPDLKQQVDLLESIPGIGPTTSAMLLSELGDISQFDNARQVAAFAGLVPHVRESGTSVRGRGNLSKIGSSRLRKSLYFPALSALRHNPIIKAFGLRLSAQGKEKMVVVGAAMRKLLHLAYGVLKSQRPFDPAFCA